MNRILLIGPVLAGLLTACASIPTPDEWEANFLAMNQADFAPGISVTDDPLNPAVEINSKSAFRDYQFSFDLDNDQFLRGYRFRDTGRVTLQGYVTSEVHGSWVQPISVTFSNALGTRAVERVHFDASRCSQYGCLHREEMVFEFTPDELDGLISSMEESGEQILKFRVQGRSGIDLDRRFQINELKAFREAVRTSLSGS